MTTPGFLISANANAASSGANAARGASAGFSAEPAAQDVDGRDGGFAAALDDAANEAAVSEASAPDRRESDADASASAAAAATLANPVAESAIDAPTNTPVADATVGLDGAASNAGGWPPPGLSSLFPASPLFAVASAPAPSTTTLTSEGALLSTPASATPLPPTLIAKAPAGAVTIANTAAPSLLARAEDGAIPLPPGLLGAALPRAPEGLPAVAVASASALGPAASPALAPLAANALDPITAALARQSAPLRLPIADEGDATGIAALADALAPERLPDGAAPLSSTGSTLPKLDLAQAFPAPVPMPSPRFAEDVGARLQWIAAQQGGDATLRIAPEGLGPVEIRLKLDGERVDLAFSASQADTRQALEQALPKLREMLAQQGLQLGDANVGQRHAGHAQDTETKRERSLADDESGIVTGASRASEAMLVVGRGARGVLDLYA